MARTPEGERKSVGIWLRVSTEDQLHGESLEHHEQRAKAYAALKEWHVAETYRLEAVSGKSVIEHPEAKRMLADIRSGAITGLVFSKLARLARNTRELLDFAEVFRSCGADMISLAESIDTSSPAGRLFFTMIAAMAQWEREEIGERVRASVKPRAELGKALGGQAPYGYRYVDKRLEPDPVEAPIRALMYELFAEHMRKKTVARMLNERGYRTRNGSAWSDTTITRLLQDPTAKGTRRANYTRTGDRAKAWELKPESDWVWYPVEPIVAPDLWERCNDLLTAQLEGARRTPSKKAVHLFSGFAFCHCGTVMYVRQKGTKYVCAGCHNKIPVDDLEEVYRAELTNFLLSPEEIAGHLQEASEAIAEKERLLEVAKAELADNEAQERQMLRLYYDHQLGKDDFGRMHRPLSERRKQLTDELPRLEAEVDALKVGMLSQEAVVQDARDLSLRWSELTKGERRAIVEAITDRIVVGTDEIEITLLNLPASQKSSQRATKPCRCGQGGLGRGACGKAPRCQQTYQGRVSGPLMDRIDLVVEVPPVTAADLTLPPPAEGSAEVGARVAAARDLQTHRANTASADAGAATLNARAEGAWLDTICALDAPAKALMARAAEASTLTARGWTRTLRLARTIADLEGAPAVRRVHVAEALIYRRVGPAAEALPTSRIGIFAG
jgi:site-specific DNA recombinase